MTKDDAVTRVSDNPILTVEMLAAIYVLLKDLEGALLAPGEPSPMWLAVTDSKHALGDFLWADYWTPSGVPV